MEFDRLLGWIEPTIDTEFATPPYDDAIAEEFLPAAGRSADTHGKLLARWNGFYAMGGMLHVFGACALPPNHSLRGWNAPDGWRAAWGRLTEGLSFFAEDGFGNQFGYRDGKVVKFRALAGGVEAVHATLTEWIEQALLDPEYALGQRLFQACVRKLGPLPRGGHFAPRGPITAGVLDPEQAQVVPARDSMELKAAAASRVTRHSSVSMRIPKT